MKRRFAGYPAAVAYDEPDGKTAVNHLLWGDYVGDKEEKQGTYKGKDVHGEARTGRYVRCHIRGRKDDCWIREHEIQDERCLEVIFVDIGQGDGSLVITPDDDKMVIDAGQEDNMYRFLRWRFGQFDEKFEFKAGIISHPDSDHYKGFEHLFRDPNVFFETIYHNGIMEESGKNPLGPKEKIGRRSFLTGLITNKTQLKEFFKDESRWRRKQFPKMLKKALDAKRFGGFKMLSIQDGYMPGYGPDETLSIQVLGPVVEPADARPPKLRWITDKGKTKNGHSVVLRCQYRDVSLLLGGDLNIPSEHLLLSHHTGLESPAANTEDESALVEAARKTFQVDIAKSCHHGSSDFTPLYLRATNPIATVISSGDAEPHSHPRADTLGAIGLHSRGGRPLIFSTELARSAPEAIKHPNILQRDLGKQLDEIAAAPVSTPAEKEARDKKVAAFKQEMDDVIDRSVAVFGAINVVTDGHKVVIAQKLEEPRGADRKWDIYRLEAEGNGPLRYQSKH